MVFLTSIDILDTGFLTVKSRTNQLGSAYRVNSGSALRLKGVDFTIESSGILDKNSTPGKIPSDIRDHEKRPLVSIPATTFTLKLFLNSNNADTNNYWGINDMTILSALLRLPHTYGFKALYYPVDNAATDSGSNTTRRRNNQQVYQLGSPDTIESQGDINMTLWTGTTQASSKDLTDVNYIPVRFESCSQEQGPKNSIIVTLTGVVTG